MKKRGIALLLAGLMALSLAACSAEKTVREDPWAAAAGGGGGNSNKVKVDPYAGEEVKIERESRENADPGTTSKLIPTVQRSLLRRRSRS